MPLNDNDKRFKFLIDQPIHTSEDPEKVKFGHQDIANTISNIVENCDTPFTIGLFGKWGSGKSTIAYLTREKLAKRGIPTIIFDVWKHEGDSLRRSFLKDLVSQLKEEEGKYLAKEFKLNDRLRSSVSKTSEGKFLINKEKVKQVWWIPALVILSLLILGLLANNTRFILYYWYLVAILTGTGICSGFLIWLIKAATQFLTTETTTVTTEKLQDPYEFEKEFERILREIKVPSRMIVIFDNLDRVARDKAMEILSTIKTFLEPKDIKIEESYVVFMIPCDDLAIKKRIEKVNKNEQTEVSVDGAEFLKKFFNAEIRIPEFISSELEVFSRSCLKETNMPCLNDSGIAWLITKAYRDNPRQIIQFVNTLLTNILLIKNREGVENDFKDDFAEDKKKEICLYLLLLQLYPYIMEEIRKHNYNNFKELQDNLEEIKNNKDFKDFNSFIVEVAPEVEITNLRPYYNLRRSDQEKKFPGIEGLFINLKDNRFEEAKRLAQRIPNIKESIEEFSLAITTELKHIKNLITARYFINSLFRLLNQLKFNLSRQAYLEILYIIKRYHSDMLPLISPKYIHDRMLVPFPEFTTDIAELWLSSLEEISKDTESVGHNREFVISVMSVFAQNPCVVKPAKQRLANLLKRFYQSDLEIIEIFTESKQAQTEFLDGLFVKAYVASLSNKDLILTYHDDANGVSKPGKLKVMDRFSPDLFDGDLLRSTINKLGELITAKTSVNWSAAVVEDWTEFFKVLHSLLNKHDLTGVVESNEFNKFVNAVIAAIDRIPSQEDRRIIMPLLIMLEALPSCPRQSELSQRQSQFYQTASLDAVKCCLEFVENVKQYVEDGPFASIFKRRSMENQSLFDYFYVKLSPKMKGDWLIELAGSNVVRATEKIKDLKYKIPAKYTDPVLNRVLSSAKAAPVEQKIPCFEVCNHMKCNGNREIMNSFVSQIKNLLCTEHSNAQKVGHDALLKADYLDDRKRREIIKSVFDWLQTLEDSEKYQEYSLDTISIYLDHLNTFEKDQLTQFCFDPLITKKTPSDPASIKKGFEILFKLKPTYEARKQNFTDIRTRYEHETDETVKKALISGLRALRPEKITKADEEFWKWFDSVAV